MKRPILRQSMTLNPPFEDGDHMPVTIEVVILSPVNHGKGDQFQAGELDVPELQEAGWMNHTISDLTVAVRIIS